mmetsp:Transcript_57874/g.146924  ORF Transcript_57874/g.146924 Transcript_57874/m.146924 type:complete len:255 (-) Transcript_57874:148-912(-)
MRTIANLAFLSGWLVPQVAWGSIEPRPTSDGKCKCQDPLTGSGCYEPVCPAGYYKCCATCTEAPCYGQAKMYLSWRGLPECIECNPGDFCTGCDTFTRCPDSNQPSRAGPRIAPAKSMSVGDCESCPVGLEASFDRGACMMKYTDVCNVDVVSRCIRSCKAEDASKGKDLTPCERMKCTMYCAKQWSPQCLNAVSQYCLFSTTLASSMQGGIEAEQGQGAIVGCDVDCSGSPSHIASMGVLAVVLAALLSGSLS